MYAGAPVGETGLREELWQAGRVREADEWGRLWRRLRREERTRFGDGSAGLKRIER